MSPQIQKIMAFEKEIKEYEDLRGKYQTLIINKMDREEYIKYNEVLFSTHSCAIEGNSFSVDDTRELKEKGLVGHVGITDLQLENLKWVIDHAAPDTRAVLWAAPTL